MSHRTPSVTNFESYSKPKQDQLLSGDCVCCRISQGAARTEAALSSSKISKQVVAVCAAKIPIAAGAAHTVSSSKISGQEAAECAATQCLQRQRALGQSSGPRCTSAARPPAMLCTPPPCQTAPCTPKQTHSHAPEIYGMLNLILCFSTEGRTCSQDVANISRKPEAESLS